MQGEVAVTAKACEVKSKSVGIPIKNTTFNTKARNRFYCLVWLVNTTIFREERGVTDAFKAANLERKWGQGERL